MENLCIRSFNNDDAPTVSKLICRNLLEVNIRDYSREKMECLSEIYSPNKVLDISAYSHMYIACIDNTIVGCGSISSFWGKKMKAFF